MKTGITIIFFLLVCSVHSNAQTNFTLPEIKTIKYLSVPSSFENIYAKISCRDSLYNFLKFYNKKLSNVGKYEVYLIKQNPKEISETSCMHFEQFEKLDFLFLFDKKSKQAFVLVAAYEFLSDSEVYNMNFTVNKNEIDLIESGFTEGDGGAEKFSKGKHKIKILKNGQFKINSF